MYNRTERECGYKINARHNDSVTILTPFGVCLRFEEFFKPNLAIRASFIVIIIIVIVGNVASETLTGISVTAVFLVIVSGEGTVDKGGSLAIMNAGFIRSRLTHTVLS